MSGGSLKNLKDLKNLARLCCGSRVRKGKVLAYGGSIKKPKELKKHLDYYFSKKDLTERT